MTGVPTAVRAPRAADAQAPADALTPTLRERARRGRTWIWLAVALLLGGAVLALLQGGVGVGEGEPLGPDEAGPAGSQALVRVLEANGVDVTVARSLETARSEAGDDATVLLYDAEGYLDRDRLGDLAEAAARLVVVEPDFSALEALAPGVRLAGAAAGALEDASCDAEAARSAGALSDGQRLLRIDDDAADDGWAGCFPAGDDAVAIAALGDDAAPELALVGARTAFENGRIDESGNAALAIGLLGTSDELIWYLPGPADVDEADAPTLAELTPAWVSPVAVLLVAVTIAAAIWRGRRFGPLVVEDLPVHVPAGETGVGRARLYERSAARTRALDQLRIGSIRRIAALLRLPRAADTATVSAAAAAVLGRDATSVHGVLVGKAPDGDRALVDLATRLDALERDVAGAIRPGATAAEPAGTELPTRDTDPELDRGRRP